MVLLCFFFILSGAISNYSTLCGDVPALHTHCLRLYITVPCCLPAILPGMVLCTKYPNFSPNFTLP